MSRPQATRLPAWQRLLCWGIAGLLKRQCGCTLAYSRNVLRLLVDTSSWLDLARRRDGQKWIVALRVLAHQGDVALYAPAVVLNEFERNRARIEASMTSSVGERFRQIKRDLDDYGGSDQEEALKVIEGLSHQVPLIGAMTTRNFDDILDLLRAGIPLEPGEGERARVVQRGLDKRVPFIGPATASPTRC